MCRQKCKDLEASASDLKRRVKTRMVYALPSDSSVLFSVSLLMASGGPNSLSPRKNLRRLTRHPYRGCAGAGNHDGDLISPLAVTRPVRDCRPDTAFPAAGELNEKEVRVGEGA